MDDKRAILTDNWLQQWKGLPRTYTQYTPVIQSTIQNKDHFTN